MLPAQLALCCGSIHPDSRPRRLLFFLTRQNELSPKYAKVKQKQMATASRLPAPALPASNLANSRTPASPPIPARARNTNPVTSSHNWWSTRPKCVSVVRAPCNTAPAVRLRLACCAATLAKIRTFCAVVTCIIGDFINVPTRILELQYATWCAPSRNPVTSIASHTGEAVRTRLCLPASQSEGPLDQQLKQLMKELGEAINESLADSEQIAEVVSRIKEGGYDIFLVLEATIGVSKQGEKPADKTSMVTTLSSNPELKVSEQDLKFLKSLRIKIEDETS